MTVTPTAGGGRPQRVPLAGRPARRRRSDRGGRGPSGAPAAWVESARVRLHDQRAFRCKQLEELADDADLATDAGAQEVQEALRGAAEAALADVDAALRRIEKGTYGRCTRCAGLVSRGRLQAVPSAPLCWTCHHAVDLLRLGTTS